MEQFLALKASAGSGKTFALTIRYISLLLLGARPKEILTLTFTNKAATQMASRIYETLLALGDDEAIIEAIKYETKLSKNEILQKKDNLIQKYISDELAIYTIDKFINKVLREFSGYIGINDDFNIKFDDEELLVYKFLISLNEKQFDTLISFAYTENKKLNSIVDIFKILNEKNEKLEVIEYSMESYLAVKEAILEDANKIKEFILKSELSNSAYKAVDFKNIEELLEKGKTWLTKESLNEFSYFKKANIPIEYDEILIDLKKKITLYFQISQSYTLKNLFNIYENFTNFRDSYNKKRNSLEFSDITNIVYKLLKTHIEKDFLYFRLDTKYNHILIDEFQDTSTLQFKILFSLIDEIISGNPEVFKTFFYVGDTKQSIYRFRGGTKELFDYVADLFNPMLEVKLLDTNYRSSKNIVEFVNNTFKPLSNYQYDKQKVNSSIDGFVEVLEVSNEKEEFYGEIYKKVQELLDKKVEPNNIAILTYTNADVLAIFEYLKQKIPSLDLVTEMTSKLINQINVKAVINGIKYLYFKQDIYKVNFNSLLGRDYFKSFDFSCDIKNEDVASVVKKLSFYFDIVDENVIKLIELSNSFESIVDFIYEIDKDDTPMVSKNTKGLTILTIFKSKGLEFDTVIVCDKITKKSPDRSSLLFEYENIELQKIYYKKQKRENFDSFYDSALKKEKKLVIADELNILYVALTRAKNNMIILKKQKNSVFEYLDNLDKQKKGILYIKPKKQSYQSSKTQLLYTPLNLGYQDKSKKQEEETSNLKARYFGIATHFCLEMMKDFSFKSLDKAIEISKNKYDNFLNLKEFNDIYNRIQHLLNDETFINIVKNSNFTKEQSLIFNGEHKIIDLFVQNDKGYFIFDYKTTNKSSSSHIDQVQNYVNAIKDITKEQNVYGYLIYLHRTNMELVKI